MELCVSVTSMLFLKFRLLFVAVLRFVAAHGTRNSFSVILQARRSSPLVLMRRHLMSC
jgi:hypothetical protein